MKKFLRAILFILVTITLLILIPAYSLLSWSCYAGLCGGGMNAEIGAKYGDFYAMFGLIYPIIVLIVLITYFVYHRIKSFKMILIIPFLCLIPFVYVEFQAQQIANKYQNEADKYYNPNPEDYVCAPGKFIRNNGAKSYLYFQVNGGSKVVSNYDYQALVNALQNDKVDISQCKNKAGTIIQSQ